MFGKSNDGDGRFGICKAVKQRDGIGLLGFESVMTRDYPVIFGTLYLLAPNMQNRERKSCFCSKANVIVVMLISATMHLHISENAVSKHIIRSNNILHKLAFKNT